jgi:hypothetical protein
MELLPEPFKVFLLEALRRVIGHEPNTMDEFWEDHIDVAGELTTDMDEVAAIVIVYKSGGTSWYCDGDRD